MRGLKSILQQAARYASAYASRYIYLTDSETHLVVDMGPLLDHLQSSENQDLRDIYLPWYMETRQHARKFMLYFLWLQGNELKKKIIEQYKADQEIMRLDQAYQAVTPEEYKSLRASYEKNVAKEQTRLRKLRDAVKSSKRALDLMAKAEKAENAVANAKDPADAAKAKEAAEAAKQKAKQAAERAQIASAKAQSLLSEVDTLQEFEGVP